MRAWLIAAVAALFLGTSVSAASWTGSDRTASDPATTSPTAPAAETTGVSRTDTETTDEAGCEHPTPTDEQTSDDRTPRSDRSCEADPDEEEEPIRALLGGIEPRAPPATGGTRLDRDEPDRGHDTWGRPGLSRAPPRN